MDYEQHIKEATILALSTGNRVFQIFQFAETEMDHCTKLLSWMNSDQNSRMLDVGCGVGEVAKNMQELRPDLQFTLLNSNQYQLSLCPESMPKIHGDMHNIPCPDASFDCVMVNYAIGYADLDRAIPEFYRVLKPEGLLFVCDIIGKNDLFAPVMEYNLRTAFELTAAIQKHGFKMESFIKPQSIFMNNFDKVLELETTECANLCRKALEGVEPCIGRFNSLLRRKI